MISLINEVCLDAHVGPSLSAPAQALACCALAHLSAVVGTWAECSNVADMASISKLAAVVFVTCVVS